LDIWERKPKGWRGVSTSGEVSEENRDINVKLDREIRD
jgi:hypothetical protein